MCVTSVREKERRREGRGREGRGIADEKDRGRQRVWKREQGEIENGRETIRVGKKESRSDRERRGEEGKGKGGRR